MKKKAKENGFICNVCGHSQIKWQGQCSNCQAWNSLIEETNVFESKGPVSITSVEGVDRYRLKTGLLEFDRVLGGGLVLGGVALLCGEPGAGKSTLLQMCASHLAKDGHKVLYVSGEESKEQIALNAKRLSALNENFYVLAESDIDIALNEASLLNPKLLVIDSVQTLSSKDVESIQGSVGQIREVSQKLISFAKGSQIPTILVGHVTKDGQIAGPRLLEHMVDTVLYFEQSRTDQHRLLRAHKNRFGSTNEIGLFEMSHKGLLGISNISAFFLEERPLNKPGSVVFCALEGTRALLMEVQALAIETAFGAPRRTSVGIDQTRVSVMAAVLEKHVRIPLSRMDLFISVAQGLKIEDPAVDLSLALSIMSSVRNIALPNDMVALGELGLSGEIRSISRLNDRLKEAARLGFNKVLVPHIAISHLNVIDNIKVKGVKDIGEAISLFV